MSEIVINQKTYMVGRLTPKQQLHLARRLLPLFVGVAPALDLDKGLPTIEGSTPKATAELDLTSMAPFVEALAQMSDEAVDAIVDPCLAVTSRKVGEAWAPVMPRPGQLMFQDMSVVDMLSLVWAVISENLGNFFPANPGKASP